MAFLHLSEPDWAGGPELDDDYRRALRAAHPGPIVGAGNYDLAKAERLLGWRARIGVEEGVAQTAEWLRTLELGAAKVSPGMGTSKLKFCSATAKPTLAVR